MKITFSDKLIAYLALLTGLSISVVAIWYSVAGLVSIFAAAAVPIIIMGVVLEVSKLIATVWLKINWKIAPILMRTYLIIAIIILMFITSMGIFGFLSKAHLDQAVPVGDVAAKVQIIDDKIKFERENIQTQKDNIAAARQTLRQLDLQVTETLARTKDATNNAAVNRSVTIRRQQAKERSALQKEIAVAQQGIETINIRIAELNQQRAPIAAEVRAVEAEVGPIRYIAALIYDNAADTDVLERAVRAVIIIIVVVFDPLAVVLLLASQYSFQHFRRVREEEEEHKGWHQEWVPDSETWPKYESDDGPLTDEQLEQIKAESGVDQDLEMTENLFDTEEEFFAHGKKISQELDANNYASTQSYLTTPWVWFKNRGTDGWVPKTEQDPLDIPVLEGEEMWAQEAIDTNKDFDAEEYYDYLDGQPELEEQEIIDAAEESEKAAMHRWKQEHPSSSLKLQRKLFERGAIKQLPWHRYLTAEADTIDPNEFKKKDSRVDGDSGRPAGEEEQRDIGYVQNAEQGQETLWQRIKKVGQ
jgi:hypothetical protein